MLLRCSILQLLSRTAQLDCSVALLSCTAQLHCSVLLLRSPAHLQCSVRFSAAPRPQLLSCSILQLLTCIDQMHCSRALFSGTASLLSSVCCSAVVYYHCPNDDAAPPLQWVGAQRGSVSNYNTFYNRAEPRNQGKRHRNPGTQEPMNP